MTTASPSMSPARRTTVGATPSGGTPSGAAPAGVSLARRLPGPDLARGGMLLLIALANVHVFTFGHLPGVRGYPAEQSAVDQVFTTAQMLLVDGRAFPLFAALLGYGLVQVAQRRDATRAGPTVRLLRRRGRWMVGIGLAHALLLFTADIVALYGLLAVLFAPLIVRADARRLLHAAAWCLPLALAFGAVRGLPAATLGLTDPVQATPVLWDGSTVLETLASRGGEWASGVLRILGLAPAVLLGAWAARQKVFGTTGYAPVLRRVAIAGLVVGVTGAVPAALLAAAVWDAPSAWVAAVSGALHLASGYAVAAAYVALFALAGNRIRQRPGIITRAVIHGGQRSLTLYLTQSVLFLAVLDPSLGGTGDDLGIALCSAVAVGVWVAGIALATLMDRMGVRGPAETFLRNRTYSTSSLRVTMHERPRPGQVGGASRSDAMDGTGDPSGVRSNPARAARARRIPC